MKDPTYFVIVCAMRTGSNLLVGLLKSHPDTTVGGEIFNTAFVHSATIPWQLGAVSERLDVIDMRSSDPIGFLDVLFDAARQQGHKAIGFKLLYDQGDDVPEIRDYLSEQRHIRIIHVKRRNLLRRFLSEMRAHTTGVWWTGKTEAAPSQPTLRVNFQDYLHDIAYVATKQAEFGEYFKDHEVLEVFYEDLASDTATVTARVVEFLGLEPQKDFSIRARKTGTDALGDAIENYDELKAQVLQMASCFED